MDAFQSDYAEDLQAAVSFSSRVSEWRNQELG